MSSSLYPMEVFWAKCEAQGHEFEVYKLLIDYGTLLARTSDPEEMAVVDGLEDPVFREVGQMTRELLAKWRPAKGRDVDCFHQVFGFACDPAPSSEHYVITYISEVVHCPICGSLADGYGPNTPRRFVERELPHVTHYEWNRMSESEKRSFLLDKLRLIGCIP